MPKNRKQPNSTLTERIQAHYNLLKKAERKVADYLMKHPNQILESSITEFSRTLGVSEATISRFSKAVGYEGFPALKLSIAADTAHPQRLPNVPTEISEADTPDDISKKLMSALTLSVRMTNSSLNPEALKATIELISNSGRLIFIGVGGAASVCVEAMHLFVKAGRRAEAISDGYTQIVTASALEEGDLLVGVSHTGQTRSVARSLAIAKEKGAGTIAITSDDTSEVARSARIVLTTWNSQPSQVPLFGDFLEGRMSQLFLVDLIYVSTLLRSQNSEKEMLLKTGDALQRFYDHN